MTRLHLRLAVEQDAAALAQLAFDVMEANPLSSAYTVKSEWSPNRKRTREIAGDPHLYNEFLSVETSNWRRDLRGNTPSNDRMICVAYDADDRNAIVGCIEMAAEVKEATLSIDRIFAIRNASAVGAFMLNAAKSQAERCGLYTVQAKAPYGVHKFFAENGFTMLKSEPAPYDNVMTYDLCRPFAGFGKMKKTTRVFPLADANPIAKPKAG